MSSYTIVIPAYLDGQSAPYKTFLTLIVPQSAISTTALDSTNLAGTNFVQVGSSGYSGARVPVEWGTHKVTSSQPFEVQVYGFGFCDAYGYIGGVISFP